VIKLFWFTDGFPYILFLFFSPEMSPKHKFSVDYVKILYSLKHFVYIIFKNKNTIGPLRRCGGWCGVG